MANLYFTVVASFQNNANVYSKIQKRQQIQIFNPDTLQVKSYIL